MAKMPKWTVGEINKLKDLLDKHKSYKEISEIMDRSITSIKITAYRKLSYTPLCLDCGIRILVRKGNKLRCEKCSKVRIIQWKKEYAKRNQEYFRNFKRENRFGGNRRLTLERDNYTCQMCKKTHHQVVLDVHHKDNSGRNKKIHNHSLENLIVLCHCCHTKLHKLNIRFTKAHRENIGKANSRRDRDTLGKYI